MSAVLTPNPPSVTPPPAGPHRWKWTREEYHRLGEQGFFHGKRVELIRGEVIEMSPMREPHACGIALTSEGLRTAFGDGFYVRTQVPLSLGSSEPEPDVAVVVGSPRDYTSPPTTALLVVEVSDSTLFYDTTTKAELYAEAGVADYWVLDLERRQLLVFRDPAPIPAGGTAYRTQRILNATETITPLNCPGSTLRVHDLLP